MKTTKSFTKQNQNRRWFVLDCQDLVLGRAASQIAKILRGKNLPTFTPQDDVGDFIVAINAEKIKLTGKKRSDKMYYHYTGHIGGIKGYNAEELLQRHPEDLLYRAVRGMLPKNTLSRHQLKKLKIYRGAEHPHASQTPEPLKLHPKM